MIQQMPGQTPIRFVREAAPRQLFQFARQSQAAVGQGVAAQAMATPGTPQRIRAVDQLQHRARQARRSGTGGFQQFLAPPLQVRQALLMSGLRELVVHAPAVMHQSARPVEAQQLLGRFTAPRRINHITRFPSADERMQPGRPAAHAPAGLVGHDLRRAADIVAQLFIRRLATLGRAGNRSGTGAPRDGQLLEQRPQQLHALAVRQAELLVHDRQCGMDVCAQLTGRRSAGRVDLQCMAAFHRLAALFAHADMHVELAIDDGAWNFGLILRRDVGFLHVGAAAMLTLFRQRHIVGLVDPRRHGAMGMWPMATARLAAWLFRLGRRFVLLAKRSGLALGLATQLLDQQQQLLDACLESAIFSRQLFVARPNRCRRLVVRSISRRGHIGYTTRIQLAGER